MIRSLFSISKRSLLIYSNFIFQDLQKEADKDPEDKEVDSVNPTPPASPGKSSPVITAAEKDKNSSLHINEDKEKDDEG